MEGLGWGTSRGQRDRIHQHYFRGKLFCGRCQVRDNIESRLIYTKAKGRTGTYYGYFLCRGRQDGICDLPHLPTFLVEQAVCDNYNLLDVGDDFIAEVTEPLSEVMADQQRLTRELHAQLTKQLEDLSGREDRLLDVAADGTLSKAKIQPE